MPSWVRDPRCRAVAVLAAGLATAPAFPADVQSVRLRAGAPAGAGQIDGGALALAIVPDHVPRWMHWIGRDAHVEVAASYWSDAAPDGAVYTAHIGPSWRFRPGPDAARGFIEAGTSLAWVSERDVDGVDLGSRWHFTTHAMLGVELGPRRRWHAGLRLRHTSNAGFSDPNPGLDIVMLEVGYRLAR